MATESELIILGVIHEHDGEWNWYKVARRCMNLVDPEQISLKSLIEGKLVDERIVDGEPLPRLFVTPFGKSALEAAGQNTSPKENGRKSGGTTGDVPTLDDRSE